jgi:hypothetical protein
VAVCRRSREPQKVVLMALTVHMASINLFI